MSWKFIGSHGIQAFEYGRLLEMIAAGTLASGKADRAEGEPGGGDCPID
jgi:hypothetical protein